ncbi:MAG: RelA/SpoT domain-containing protein [Chloroflexi bacterium]|nr:RelA/SpoT domain-containing protein [Chloroflexota bacterium]
MNKSRNLQESYEQRLEKCLIPLAKRLESYLLDLVTDEKLPRIDKVVARPKALDSFLEKAKKIEEGKPKYSDPLNQIQDQLGARIVAYYLSDIEPLQEFVKKYFGPIEEKTIVPDTPSEFGYEGLHFILFIPEDVFDKEIDRDDCPRFFELQVKTLFQHAWALADHDLGYKPANPLTKDQQRRVAFTAAQAWGADVFFSDLYTELNK